MILDEITRRAHFIVLIDPDTRLGGPAPTTVWMQREIARALAVGANIVPVMIDGARFEDLALPEEIAGLAGHTTVVFLTTMSTPQSTRWPAFSAESAPQPIPGGV